MTEITSRYNNKIIIGLLLLTATSFMLSLALMQIFAALLVLMWGTEKWENKKKAFGLIEKVFLVFVCLRLLSVLFSPYPESSNQSFYKDALFHLSFLPFGYYFRTVRIKDRELLLDVFTCVAAFVALIGIFRFSMGYVHRASSIGSGYSTFGIYLLCSLSLLFRREYKLVSQKERIILVIKGGIILTGLVLSICRTEIGIAVIIMTSAFLFKKIAFTPAVIMFVIAAGISIFAFSLNKSEIKARAANPSGLSDRDVIWSGAYSLAFQRPFLGFGPRTFKDVFPYFDKLSDKEVGGWHNDYISVYMESGIFTAMSLLALLSGILFTGVKKIRNGNADETGVLWAVVFSLASLFLSAIMSGFVTSPILSIMFNYLTGMLIASAGSDSGIVSTQHLPDSHKNNLSIESK